MERKRKSDKEKAKNLIISAEKEVLFTLTIPVSQSSSNTIIKNIYESFRMLGESILINRGIEFTDHIQSINELINLNLSTKRPLALLDNLRRLRHKINYDGYGSTIEEANEAVSIAKTLFKQLKKEVEENIKTSK